MTMTKKMKLGIFLLAVLLEFSLCAVAQQTLGGITGTVADKSGSVLPDSTVTIVGDQTKLTRTQKTNGAGAYDFVNLPIGTYTVTVEHDGFQTEKLPAILVQANRTATLNIAMKVGQVGTTVEVQAAPAMNSVDTTNGYILEKEQIDEVPLPTGSFTGLAILSPGVNAELPAGTGVNQGLGNQPIWANGQRDTSNTFLLNGVDASNLFNGKSTSSVASARIVNNTGVSGAGSTTAEVIQSTASPYLAIGQALPTPAPETVQEFRVNTSMYDAQQGSTSGAHIDLSTASGTNSIHGVAYVHRGTDAFNAAPYFYKQDGNIPANQDVPQLHRYTAGGTLGGPLIKDKLFGYISYQHTHASDLEIGTSRTAVPTGLGGARDAATLAAVDNVNFRTQTINNVVYPCNTPVPTPYTEITCLTAAGVDSTALTLLNYKLPNGQFLFPSANPNFAPSLNFPENAFLTQPAYFISDQAVADIDYQPSSKDTLSLKYYYQHDPTTAPFAYSAVEGFPQRLDAGSQVASITNTQSIRSNLSVAEVFGFIREKVYSTIGQPFSAESVGINNLGSNVFPGITIVDDLGNSSPLNTNFVFNAGTTIGSTAASQGAFTGIFQNRWMPSANAIWNLGKHTITFGGSFSYTQLNARDERTNQGMIGFVNWDNFLTGSPVTYTADGFITTTFLQGDANRYYRSNETGWYVQDKFQVRSNLSFSGGIRFDYHGGLKEKNGRIFNFDPSRYSYDATSDTITNNGFIVAGNNPDFPSKGVSDSTLTGRQWGLAPRIGVAWSPRAFNDKVVVRAGWGLYYDRGELFTYLSPGFASGVIAGGPFGVNQTPPWVNQQSCSTFGYSYCSTFEAPWGTTLGPGPSGNPADLALPNAGAIESGAPLFSFADYNRANKLPYTMNQTLDIQWQPRNDLVFEIGYVGNLGRHEVVPLPFNQAQIASPTHPTRAGTPVEQDFTYGYSIVTAPGSFNTINLPTGSCATCGQPYQETFEGGNVDLRVPYLGYSAESESYTAAGISAYHALQAHMEKRMSHGLSVGASYTFSHATDEQSAMGLFYNGNNPLNLRSGYGLSDFDRKHVLNFTYTYQLPKFFPVSSLRGKIVDGWAISGLTVIQSGQPYSVVDYSGAVGSIFYGVNDGIGNPIVPLTSCSPKQALTGASGAHYNGDPKTLALNPTCFGLPLLNPGDLNGAIPSNDPYETNFIASGQRNIFRQSWQRNADVSISKITQFTERVSLKYQMDVFNITNTASFDIPIDDVSQNINFNGFPVVGQAGATTPCNTDFTAIYVCPSLSGLGITNKTIGHPRQIQMSLHLVF
ncbi:MAG TPA: TonB-dependent receptor [Candidatus Sulfotelmatobacter sp.]|nr:TonB-dependent receptor [Candidatus Sulfotelmatobacter sp.]